MVQVYRNNLQVTLASTLFIAQTSCSLSSGHGARIGDLTGDEYLLLTGAVGSTLETDWEIIKVTARAGDVLTLERAQEGTTAKQWDTGTTLVGRITAGTIEKVRDVPHPQRGLLAVVVRNWVFGRDELLFSSDRGYTWFPPPVAIQDTMGLKTGKALRPMDATPAADVFGAPHIEITAANGMLGIQYWYRNAAGNDIEGVLATFDGLTFETVISPTTRTVPGGTQRMLTGRIVYDTTNARWAYFVHKTNWDTTNAVWVYQRTEGFGIFSWNAVASKISQATLGSPSVGVLQAVEFKGRFYLVVDTGIYSQALPYSVGGAWTLEHANSNSMSSQLVPCRLNRASGSPGNINILAVGRDGTALTVAGDQILGYYEGTVQSGWTLLWPRNVSAATSLAKLPGLGDTRTDVARHHGVWSQGTAGERFWFAYSKAETLNGVPVSTLYLANLWSADVIDDILSSTNDALEDAIAVETLPNFMASIVSGVESMHVDGTSPDVMNENLLLSGYIDEAGDSVVLLAGNAGIYAGKDLPSITLRSTEGWPLGCVVSRLVNADDGTDLTYEGGADATPDHSGYSSPTAAVA